MELSDKEKKLLEDQLKAEYICMSKYKLYSEQAGDPQIKNIQFNFLIMIPYCLEK
jgi:hypothetical protein